MAATKAKKKTTVAVDLPECPACLKGMAPPIVLCQSGHSLCGPCVALRPPACPLCRQPMTQMRNRSLEELINKAEIPCPHRAAGCPLSPRHAALADHAAECAFRPADCPLAAVLGKCSWTGQWKQILDHIKEKHPSSCVFALEADKELQGITLGECDRHVFLAAHQKLIFIVTFKIDSVQRMAYWTVQLTGPKKQAHQYTYLIQVASKREPQRKVIFTETCASDTLRADDIFRQNVCAVLPLDSLAHFVKDGVLAFRYSIRSKSANKPKGEGSDVAAAPQSPDPNGPGAGKGPGQNGPGKSIDLGVYVQRP